MKIQDILNELISEGSERTYTALKAEWSKINQNTKDYRGFGEGNSPDEGFANEKANYMANVVLARKLNTSTLRNTSIEDSATFYIDGKYYVLVIRKSEGNPNELEERSRSFAHTRKKRLFPKSAMMANPARFKSFDKKIKGIEEV